MNNHNAATLFLYPTKGIAAAWREHAQRHGMTDPETELLAREAVSGSPRAGYRPAFYVPSTGEMVVILAEQPHRTQADAINWLRWLLEQLHANGNITFYAPAREAIA